MASKFDYLAAFVTIFSYVLLHMCRNGYFGASVDNFDISIQSLDPDFLTAGEISAVWGRF